MRIGPEETREDLQRRGFRFIQPKRGNRFGLDAVLLAYFAAARPGERVLDLCCGSGIVPVLLAARQPGLSLTGVEIYPPAAELARRNGALNGLPLRVICGDLRELPQLLPGERFSLVTANPPYFPLGTGKLSPDPALALARHEVACTLRQVVERAAGALSPGGRLCLVLRGERQPELLAELERAGLAVRRVRPVFVRPGDAGKTPRLVLAEGVRPTGREAVAWEEAPLFLQTEAGAESPELRHIYET